MSGGIPINITDVVSIVASVLGVFILLFGLGSMPIKDWFYLSEPCRYSFTV
jgi:hypothetical protein